VGSRPLLERVRGGAFEMDAHEVRPPMGGVLTNVRCTSTPAVPGTGDERLQEFAGRERSRDHCGSPRPDREELTAAGTSI
jgi:hypothetical protein